MEEEKSNMNVDLTGSGGPNRTNPSTTAEAQAIVSLYSPQFGTDPELFIERKGEGIIGAEKVIPAEGLSTKNGSEPTIVLDGVQIELHPSPTTCRALLGNEMSLIFQKLKEHLASIPNLTASFTGVVEVSKKEMNSLSEGSRKLGCMPSKNAYKSGACVNVGDGHPVRSAGGHIHIGDPVRWFLTDFKNHPQRIKPSFYGRPSLYGKTAYVTKDISSIPERETLFVRILDLCVGNTGVLLDRDPLAAKRRELYGRAGEYRTPEWGFEYRTLSNFWLRSYPLMSQMMGLARLAFQIVWNQWDPQDLSTPPYSDSPVSYVHSPGKYQWRGRYNPISPGPEDKLQFSPWPAYDTLMRGVDQEKVERAINTNDWNLAYENWKILRDFVGNHVLMDLSATVWSGTVDIFDYYLRQTKEKGIEFWFPEDPMTFWTESYSEGHGTGAENFLSQIVHRELMLEKLYRGRRALPSKRTIPPKVRGVRTTRTAA